MKTLQKILTAAILAFATVQAVPAQEPQQPDINQIINNLLDNLTNSYKLDDVQVFYVDSILQYNYPAMMAEIEATEGAGGDPDNVEQQYAEENIDSRRPPDHPDEPIDQQADHKHVEHVYEGDVDEVKHILQI